MSQIDASQDDRLERLMLGELSPDEEAALAIEAAADPALARELERVRRLRRNLEAAGPAQPLAESVVVPPPLESPPPMPAGLLARLKAIPDLEPSPAAAQVAERAPIPESTREPAREPVPDRAARPTPGEVRGPARPEDHPSILDRLLGWWRRPQWALAGGLAVALLIFALLPLLRTPGPEVVFKGPGEGGPGSTRPLASLELVGRDTPEGEVYRLAIEPIEPGLMGARVRRDQTVLPVVLSRDVDLSAGSWYVMVVALDAAGGLHRLSGPREAAPLRRLPDTEALFALPEPVVLEGLYGGGPARYRLYALVTKTAVPMEPLTAAAAGMAGDLRTPRSLIDAAFPEVEGLEASLLVELR